MLCGAYAGRMPALREESGFLAEGLAVGAVPGEVGVLAGAVDGDFGLADGAGESGAIVDAVGVRLSFGGEGGGGGDESDDAVGETVDLGGEEGADAGGGGEAGGEEDLAFEGVAETGDDFLIEERCGDGAVGVLADAVGEVVVEGG